MRASYGALLLMAIVSGPVSRSPMRALKQCGRRPGGRNRWLCGQRRPIRCLRLSLRIRIAFGLAVVFLMIAKPRCRRIAARSGAGVDGDDRHESYQANHAVHGRSGISMNTGLIARASVTIAAPAADVWEALVTPAAIKAYMFGATVTSDWVVGSPIVWTGEWQGRRMRTGDHSSTRSRRVLGVQPFSSLTGMADLPENYRASSRCICPGRTAQTRVLLYQDNNPTEQARQHAERNWAWRLTALKHFVEHNRDDPH